MIVSFELFAKELKEKEVFQIRSSYLSDNLVERGGKKYKINSKIPFSGDVVSYHPNGQVKMKKFYKNGLEDGKQIFFHDNGETNFYYYAVMGINEGEFIGFDKSGDKSFEALYKNDTIIESTRFADDGTPYFIAYQNWKYEETKESDIIVETKTIEIDGKEITDVSYKRTLGTLPVTGRIITFYDKSHGPSVLHDKLVYRGSAINGQETGVWEYFWGEPYLIYSVNYKNGLRNGISSKHKSNGDSYDKKCWHNGIQVDMSVCIEQ